MHATYCFSHRAVKSAHHGNDKGVVGEIRWLIECVEWPDVLTIGSSRELEEVLGCVEKPTSPQESGIASLCMLSYVVSGQLDLFDQDEHSALGLSDPRCLCGLCWSCILSSP